MLWLGFVACASPAVDSVLLLLDLSIQMHIILVRFQIISNGRTQFSTEIFIQNILYIIYTT
jgi:hypothetical protein